MLARIFFVFLLCGVPLWAVDIRVEVDFDRVLGPVKRLHGFNKGPLVAGGLIDLTEAQRAVRPPVIRLHDCHWPNADVVDMHCVFPDAGADPDVAASYDFAATDDYVRAARATGARLVYRLGESIEHKNRKRFVHPPADVGRWADAAAGVVRHYREQVEWWEIWNEPENRPACWTGTDEQWFALYATTFRRLKREWPELKVGGPAVGAVGTVKDGRFEPSAFVRAFVDFCRRDSVVPDFFSWHTYTDEAAELSAKARGVREMLDAAGWQATASHLNEWNHLPGNTWAPLAREAEAEKRQRFVDEMSGAAGAAFVAEALVTLQEAPVDEACLFHGETGAFGLFSEQGVPRKNWHALRAFDEWAEGERVAATVEGAVVAASVGKVRRVLVAVRTPGEHRVRVPQPEAATARLVDGRHDLTEVKAIDGAFDCSGPAVLLVTWPAP